MIEELWFRNEVPRGSRFNAWGASAERNGAPAATLLQDSRMRADQSKVSLTEYADYFTAI